MKGKRGVRAVLLGLAMATVGVLVWVAPTMADPPGCADGNFCVWNQQDFNGLKYGYENPRDQWTPFGTGYHAWSAKNYFGNRKVKLRSNVDGSTRCLDPNEKRGSMTPGYDEWKAGDPGSDCPNN